MLPIRSTISFVTKDFESIFIIHVRLWEHRVMFLSVMFA